MKAADGTETGASSAAVQNCALSETHSVTVVALIGAPTVREGLLKVTQTPGHGANGLSRRELFALAGPGLFLGFGVDWLGAQEPARLAARQGYPISPKRPVMAPMA